jgi:hypothetical protein
MKMKWMLPLFLLLPLTMFGQSLVEGAVVTAQPQNLVAFDFVLNFGGYSQSGGELGNFWYQNGKFHLQKSGGLGVCPAANGQKPGCQFDGKMGKLSVAALDPYCSQITFPITQGEFRILNIRDSKNVSAIYSQTLCIESGVVFMAGGSLVVHLR